MSFTKVTEAGRPTWTAVIAAATTFRPLSSTGQTQIVGGYGSGGFGRGGYGSGETITITYNTTLNTTWTPFTAR